MDGQGRPESEGMRVEVKEVADGGEYQEGDGVQGKTVASDTAISSSSALSTGAMAAMALPPQMAVPKAMSRDVGLSTRYQPPDQPPAVNVSAMLTTVRSNRGLPFRRTCPIPMPKPSPTTDNCSSCLLQRAVTAGDGFPAPG